MPDDERGKRHEPRVRRRLPVRCAALPRRRRSGVGGHLPLPRMSAARTRTAGLPASSRGSNCLRTSEPSGSSRSDRRCRVCRIRADSSRRCGVPHLPISAGVGWSRAPPSRGPVPPRRVACTQRTGRAGPSKLASIPSPARLPTRPRRVRCAYDQAGERAGNPPEPRKAAGGEQTSRTLAIHRYSAEI